MAMDALLLECADNTFDHSILLRTVWRDELLFEAITSDETGVIAARQDEAIIGSQQEGVLNLTERSVTSNESLFKCCPCGRGFAGSGELPTQEFPRMAIDDESEPQPAIASAPDTAQICRPALIRSRCDRRKSVYAGSMTYRPLPNLPTLEFEDPLHGVLVEAE